MNINTKNWSYKNLGGIFSKDILIQVLFKYIYYLKGNRIIPTKYRNFSSTKIGKIIYFDTKKNDWFHLHSMLSHNLLKAVIASIFVVIFMSMLSMPFSNAEKPIANYVNIQVRSGDTVWTIAARNASNEEDIRDLVYAIKTMNELDHNALIYSGQTLKVPTPSNFNR